MKFYGREKELAILKQFNDKKIASFIVTRGRRRIGKSRLIEEFAKGKNFFHFSGVSPEERTTAQHQREEFANQLVQHNIPLPNADDWNNLFWALAEATKTGECIILLDEISWMGSKDPNFLGKLKNAWDIHFKKNTKLMLIICGSASSWIEKNILSNTGFVGRISQTLTIKELPIPICNQFWGAKTSRISSMEKLKLLSICGGVPRYLEEISPALSAEENIKRLCFTHGALLEQEFDHIFTSMFLRDSDTYKAILKLLVSKHMAYKEISKALNLENSGRVLEYLEELELAGFLTRDYTWITKTGKDSKLSTFRLSDCYLRFYLKYIEPNKTKIKRQSFELQALSNLPNWDGIMALQFENLVLNNREFIWKKLGISPDEIKSENPYFQRKTKHQSGCQIDYLIQTRFNTFYICEIKFSQNLIQGKIIQEIDKKMDALLKPKSISCRPVLIHINGVQDIINDSDFFSNVIDFSEIFKKS